MTPMRITVVLSVLAAVLVLLTRVRLAKDAGAGRLSLPTAVLNLHPVAGVPARGRHSSSGKADTWGEGPGLSVLAHVGLLVGVTVFTSFLVAGEL